MKGIGKWFVSHPSRNLLLFFGLPIVWQQHVVDSEYYLLFDIVLIPLPYITMANAQAVLACLSPWQE